MDKTKNKKWREKNKDKIRLYQIKYREENNRKEERKRYYKKNKKKVIKQVKNWKMKNREKILKIKRKSYQKNKERNKEKNELRCYAYRKLKEKIIKERGNKCEICGSKENLELHHEKYTKSSKDIKLLCRKCHNKKHNGRGD